jgi:purine-nucleoside phosphorylase
VFADMTHAFSQVLNAELINAAANVGIFPRLGVYQGNLGPQFSTPAEVHAARRNGADILGHAVIPETIVGTAAGCRVSALVLVAETAPSYRGKRVTHQDVTDAIEFCSPELMRGLRRAFRHGELFAAPAEQNQPAETSGIDLRLGLF